MHVQPLPEFHYHPCRSASARRIDAPDRSASGLLLLPSHHVALSYVGSLVPLPVSLRHRIMITGDQEAFDYTVDIVHEDIGLDAG